MRSHRKRPWGWAAAVFLAVASLVVTTLTTQVGAASSPTTTASPFQGAVEDDGADCPVSPGSPISSSQLPDPFVTQNGTPVTTQEQWRCRRAEIREMAERHVYGDKPAPPDSVTGTVTNSQVTVNVSDNGRSASFSASVSLPSGTGPFPAVIVYGGFGADTTT
ncbi:glucuronyl esterase domain-containing protein, partial [Streptomyces sp. 4N509B]|uniref:glucuronyl esterase domain-containing protein n=1 Tax=Streptomyces sp. 4N509B TaxID=3457413 RepID=UPI003FD45302